MCKDVSADRKDRVGTMYWMDDIDSWKCSVCGKHVDNPNKYDGVCPECGSKEGTMEITMEQEDFGTLCICAIRYCQGRQTYMPELVQGIVRQHLKEISDKDLHVMIEDCRYQNDMNLYGDERIDKPNWLKWKQDLLAEQERRNNGKF